MSDEKTMYVKYEEGPASLELPTLNLEADRGESVEVPESVGKQLLQQGWTKAEKPRKSGNNEAAKAANEEK